MRSIAIVRVISMLAVMFAMLLSVPSTTMAKPGNNGGPGNSGAAKMCQDGGWMHLARSQDGTIGFANQDECVSYGAQGGTLVPVVPEGIFIPAGSTVTFTGVLRGCNGLAGSWTATNGASGTFGSFVETYYGNCGTELPILATAGPFLQGTVITVTLNDTSCGAAYTQDSNHGSWSATGTGYQVDIYDAGTGCTVENAEVIPGPGDGHLSVSIDVAP